MTILGAGMVHPTVLRNGGFDPAEYQGYAFGMGPDRMTMLRHGIGDIRLFFSADLRFVTQFAEGPDMRVPLSWLREYVDFDLSPRALAEELTMRGMEVSAVETAGADWTDVVVGRVLEVKRHPNADTLWLTRVDVGEAGGELEIVCGAQNLEVGQLVPAALVGAVLAGDRRIERSKIRGEVSNGMLCSAIELGLGTDADGIHILGHGDEIALGTPLAEVVGEIVLDVDVKPNRGDALSMVGLAREIAAFTGGELRLPDAAVIESDERRGPTSRSASRSRS